MVLKGIAKNKKIFLILWIVLFAFQDFFSKLLPIFSYIDELPFLLLLVHVVICFEEVKTILKEKKIYVILFSVFIVAGLIGNIVYRYQPIKYVIIDLITNVKFYATICYFSFCVGKINLKDAYIQKTVKIISIILITLFLIDRVFNIFPGEIRYGIRSTTLFYGHPTYLAGVCAFLIAILTINSPKKNALFIGMNLLLLIFTLRSKAIVSAVVYVALLLLIKRFKYKVKVSHLLIMALIGCVLGWSKIHFYFIDLGGVSARSVMLITSLIIMKDYFPLGTGFGTFASHVASAEVNYSPVYVKYGFEKISELSNTTINTFFDDQFWPIIFGQTGVVGTVCYIIILYYLFKTIQSIYNKSLNEYICCLFIFCYLLISSIAEPAFNNSIAIPFAFVLASCFQTKKRIIH